MQRSCKELKRIARENLENKYSVPMLAYLSATLITSLVQFPFTMLQTEETLSPQNIILYVAELLISVVAIVLTCGEYRIHLSIARGQKTSVKELFYPIKNQPDRYILGQALYLGIILLSMLPLILSYAILGLGNGALYLLALPLSILSCILVIFVTLNFDLVFFFMLDHENLSVLEAFKECRKLMKGNKGRYFYITLSFLGMLLLCVLSLGLAIIWVQPYMNQTVTLFYLDVTGQLDAVETAKKERQNTVYS